jgi:DNA-binding SARP family transcriptional activator
MITPIVPSHATPVDDPAGSDPPALQLALLSGFELRGAGHRIDLPLSSQRVVAFLALQEHPVQRVYVAGNLWIDSSEERASSCLRTALWRMRQPDCEIVASTSTHLGLARELHVDLRDCRDRARRIVSGSAGSQRDDVDGLALAGDVLPDWYDDWVLLERERFRQLRLHALEALCQELAGRGCFAQAAEAGLAAVEVEPLRESAHRVLVEMYLAEGNPCEAIRQYRFYRDLLWRELQLEPSPMMCDLMGGLPVA